MTDRCCPDLARHLDGWSCDRHADRFACPDALVAEAPNGSVGLIIHDGGTSAVLVRYCPWCGAPVPS